MATTSRARQKVIEDSVPIEQDTVDAGPNSVPVRGVVTTTADPTREIVSAASWVGRQQFLAFQAYVRSLPAYIDDISRDFGYDIYLRMMYDPQTDSTVDLVRLKAVANGFQLSIPDNTPDAEQAMAQRILDFCQYNLDHLQTPFPEVCYELTEGVVTGYKAAEQIYAYEDLGRGEGMQMVLVALKCKPNNFLSFVVDDKNNVLGLMARRYGQMLAGLQPVEVNPQTGEIVGLIPRSKFAIFSFKPRNGDPRGTSILRPVYTQWWMKMQVQADYLAYLATYAQPGIKGVLAENAAPTPEIDSSGIPTGRILYPAEEMRKALEAYRNGGILVIPHGSDALPFQVSGEGKVFDMALDSYDRQIAKGITKQTLATEEGEHQARAASTTHQDILAMPSNQITETLARTIHNDVLRPLVLYNYGADKAHLVPHVTAAVVEQQDFPANAVAVAALVREGYFMEEQFPELDEFLGFQVRDITAWLAKKEADAQLAAAQAQASIQTTLPAQQQGQGQVSGGK